MRPSILVTLATLVPLLASPCRGADDVYDAMKRFLDQNFKGEGFLPTPYGADDRFAPKSVWVYLENAQAKGWKSATTKAWLVFSSGESLYPASTVPLRTRRVNTQRLSVDAQSKLALVVSLTGEADSNLTSAALKALAEKSVQAEIVWGDVEVEYCYYFDMLQAQSVNDAALKVMTKLLQDRFGGKAPERRVITAALRVRNAVVSLSSKSGVDLSADVSLSSVLTGLGFAVQGAKKSTAILELGPSWQYLGYQALVSDEAGKVSSLSSEGGTKDFTTRDENLPLGTLPPPKKP